MHKSLLECALSLRRGEVIASDLVTAASNSIKKYGRMNAFLEVDTKRAMDKANEVNSCHNDEPTSLIRGTIISVKDNFMIKNTRTSAGSRMLENFTSDYDATVVSRFEANGGIFLGKTNMDEFGMGSAMINSAYGPTANPWQEEIKEGVVSPGGSSGAAAAAVAARLSHASIGSDTGGSVRQPASFCGCVGLKPTYGRLSRYGLISYASSMDCPGILTRSVLDAGVVLDTMSGYDSMDPSSIDVDGRVVTQLLGNDSLEWNIDKKIESLLGMQGSMTTLEGVTIGVPIEYHTKELDHRIQKIWNDTLLMLRDSGAIIKHVSLPSLVTALPTYYTIACAEASSNLSRYDGIRYGHRATRIRDIENNSRELKSLASDLHEEISQTRGEAFGSEVLRRILTGTYVLSQSAYHDYYENALHCRNKITQEMLNQMKASTSSDGDKVDCFLGPTTPILPFYVYTPPSVSEMYYNDILTVPANLAGLPALSVPAGMVHRENFNENEPLRMPVGMQIIGPHFSEDIILRIGLAIESRSGMKDLIPPMIDCNV